ncbi:hypothetical protein H257_19551 [Aphanomyces astaci]|uniref:Crinkler effector protein N-terminal domain-containing protein n=1 Tax=Aphanomyces astaci TaxID=112090 RepID=W4F7S3_APHAT|nr:hypothetical protein H257_19551 [Aphanomyces astaci]ETV63525.1 hypothetical protein H257_19551 [Aphanomyces astaci]|eukprot:XP_009846991.1 hypothetical protein H257_19551 [Aphanomyces astaci]
MLKDKIKEKKPASITCDADALELYRAFKDGALLNSEGAKAVTLNDLQRSNFSVKLDDCTSEVSSENVPGVELDEE